MTVPFFRIPLYLVMCCGRRGGHGLSRLKLPETESGAVSELHEVVGNALWWLRDSFKRLSFAMAVLDLQKLAVVDKITKQEECARIAT